MSAVHVAAIKAELGLPESLVDALPIVGAANLAMGMELDESATLPTMVQKGTGTICYPFWGSLLPFWYQRVSAMYQDS